MAFHTEKAQLITDRLLRSWVRCRRKAWLDKYGEKNKRLWTAHNSLKLDHQHHSFVSFMNESPRRGLQACKEGASFVTGLKLKGKTPSGQVIEARPPLLKKVPGISKWGQFSYLPVVTRQGYKITLEHKLSVTFSAFLLEKIQLTPVDKALLISKTVSDLETENFLIPKKLNRLLLENLIKLRKDLSQIKPPPLTSNRRKCSICSWQNLCGLESKNQGHLSEVSGIGAKRLEMLKGLGISNLQELASTNPIELKRSLGVPHGEVAHQIIQQALVQLKQKELKISPTEPLPELNKAKGVLLYDIESDPDMHHDFLHGFVPVHHESNNKWAVKESKYKPMLTLSNSKINERVIWKRLKRKLEYYNEWPILHYGETESLSLYKLAKRQNASNDELEMIKNRCIDIHARLTKHWQLPINNYGLKSVASFIDFKWSQEGIDGPKALLWWRQWNSSRKSSKYYSKNLKYIYEYNKDDCLATWAIAAWLIKKYYE